MTEWYIGQAVSVRFRGDWISGRITAFHAGGMIFILTPRGEVLVDEKAVRPLD